MWPIKTPSGLLIGNGIFVSVAVSHIASVVSSADASATATLPGTGITFFHQQAAPSHDPLPIRRRDGTSCDSGHHACVDIGFDDLCCANDHYCYVNRAQKAQCCSLALDCPANCARSEYQCEDLMATTVPTAAVPLVLTTNDLALFGEGLSDMPTGPAVCCARSCTEPTFFRCASSLGGGCCPYGATCAADGSCDQTGLPTFALSETCTADSTSCDGSVGSVGITCCPTTTDSLSDDDETDMSGQQQGRLSDAAKGGIGAGAVVGVCLLVTMSVLLCRRQRRRRVGGENNTPGGPSWGYELTMSEALGGSRSRRRRRRRTTSATAAPSSQGPFSDLTGESAPSPIQDRAVPTQPHGPADITQAHELDSKLAQPIAASEGDAGAEEAQPVQATAGVYELYGSERFYTDAGRDGRLS